MRALLTALWEGKCQKHFTFLLWTVGAGLHPDPLVCLCVPAPGTSPVEQRPGRAATRRGSRRSSPSLRFLLKQQTQAHPRGAPRWLSSTWQSPLSKCTGPCGQPVTEAVSVVSTRLFPTLQGSSFSSPIQMTSCYRKPAQWR